MKNIKIPKAHRSILLILKFKPKQGLLILNTIAKFIYSLPFESYELFKFQIQNFKFIINSKLIDGKDVLAPRKFFKKFKNYMSDAKE